ncbi:MAG: ABC transporter ATP-binding protein/permease [Yaniella sp.]|uniref:ABC transporter ATP-binding protein n=5 Tax=Yaniella sp. TaxID=2773929 RepID=UPI0026472117|nr:ABC transporter ATP-binding protein [Yaniella sp.]MDN5703767.1 ABC transporter ATP-binding protein/permease [Yaniella sp.]MDN5814819.1 ABC transporter ATP-binding protein/permease [Yaniella sp.]MDN5818401.1 ABC transporter ATP-binding protein/permease [Yaniella sp.]MDN5838505.1 ABC transporter ATP-binding protein/permease [Yaniella sp.]MDN5889639.1 ABC transporter ATP-binding protein/permease [Yaniella sp.]
MLKLLARFGRPYLGHILAVIALQLLTVGAILFLPALNAQIIDDGIAAGDTGVIWSLGGIMLAVAFAQLASAIASVWFAARSAMSIGRDLRAAIFRRVSRFSSYQMSQFGPATLITRATNDVQQLQMVTLMSLSMLVMAPIMAAGGVVMALREDAGLSWLVWVAVPIIVVIMVGAGLKMMPLFRQMQEAIDDVNHTLREQITGMRVVRAFVRQDYETQRFTKANQHLTDLAVGVGKIFVLLFPLISLVLHIATAAVLWFGGMRVADGLVEVGSLTAFMQYLLQILMAVMMATMIFLMIPRAMVAAKRINEVLATEPELAEGTRDADDVAGHLEFRDVSFSYPGADQPVLEDISFTAAPGQTIGIIGSTGSGKTTLLNLIPRLIDTSAGQVLIDDVDVTDYSRAALSKIVGMVPQKAYLFSGTVASNVRFGAPDATDDDVWHALETAQAHDFVTARQTHNATGLASAIAQGGTDVSGGQRQRLAIGRALAAKPKIYLFDDSFSALDATTDAALRDALAEQLTEVTILIVAQRVATIQNADHILVLEHGRIVDAGTHEQLVESSTVYQQIVASQVGHV